jgi:hypothetical protein
MYQQHRPKGGARGHHTSAAFSSEYVHHTMSQYYAMWHMLRWMQQHQDYLSAATTVVEYATKTALFHYLPQNRASYYAHALTQLGFNVDSVGIGALGQRAMEMAVPIFTDLCSRDTTAAVPHQSGDYHCDDSSPNHPAAFLAGNAALSIIHHIIDQIRDIAGMQLENDDGHRKMAKYISEAHVRNPAIQITQAEFTKAAFDAYGKGAHWLALALPEIEHNGGVMLFQETEALAHQLKLAYTYWTGWARRFLPELNKLQAQTSHMAVAFTEHPCETGLFVQNVKAPLPEAAAEAAAAAAAAAVSAVPKAVSAVPKAVSAVPMAVPKKAAAAGNVQP